MAWIAKMMRGQRVLARCDEAGKLASEGGRVEIRYKPNDGRAYRAFEGNLGAASDAEVLPDDHCGPAGDPGADKAAQAEKKAAAKQSVRSGGAKPAEKHSEHPGGVVVVYADGACTGNPGPAGLGVVIYDGDARRELSEYLGKGTNNIAELTAIQRAAEALAGDGRAVEIRTDSKYSIGVLSQGWKAKANVELVAEVKSALAKLGKWRLTYVPGHAGVAGNERADELARNAVGSRESPGWKELKIKRPATAKVPEAG